MKLKVVLSFTRNSRNFGPDVDGKTDLVFLNGKLDQNSQTDVLVRQYLATQLSSRRSEQIPVNGTRQLSFWIPVCGFSYH